MKSKREQEGGRQSQEQRERETEKRAGERAERMKRG